MILKGMLLIFVFFFLPVRLILAVAFFDLAKQQIAHFLRVTEQHGCVRLVEYGIVDCSVANAERALHHDDLIGEIRKIN